jgi:hypothetical protein
VHKRLERDSSWRAFSGAGTRSGQTVGKKNTHCNQHHALVECSDVKKSIVTKKEDRDMANQTEDKANQGSDTRSGGNIETKGASKAPNREPDDDATRSGGNVETKGASRIAAEDTPDKQLQEDQSGS